MSVINGQVIPCEITLLWMSLDLSYNKSTLVQVKAWCHQATSHYLNQCWPRSVSPYGVTGPQWVKERPLWLSLACFQLVWTLLDGYGSLCGHLNQFEFHWCLFLQVQMIICLGMFGRLNNCLSWNYLFFASCIQCYLLLKRGLCFLMMYFSTMYSPAVGGLEGIELLTAAWIKSDSKYYLENLSEFLYI